MKKALLMAAIFMTSHVQANPDLYVAFKVGTSVTKGKNASYTYDLNYIDYDSEYRSKLNFYDVNDSALPNVAVALGRGLEMRGKDNLRVELEYAKKAKTELNHKYGINVDTYYGVQEAYGFFDVDLETQTLFLNGYYDFDTNSKFTPYVGFGVGVSRIKHGLKYTDPYFMNVLMDKNDTTNNFVWNLGLGVAYKFSDLVTIDADYRYSDLGEIKDKYTIYNEYYGSSYIEKHGFKLNPVSHDFTVALRYKF